MREFTVYIYRYSVIKPWPRLFKNLAQDFVEFALDLLRLKIVDNHKINICIQYILYVYIFI